MKAKRYSTEEKVRLLREVDPLRQALLEIYAAVVAGAKHNDFDTH